MVSPGAISASNPGSVTTNSNPPGLVSATKSPVAPETKSPPESTDVKLPGDILNVPSAIKIHGLINYGSM